MAKRIAVVSYDLDPNSTQTADAVVVRNTLNTAGYTAQLVHQWTLDETNAGMFRLAASWTKDFDGIVLCGFYGFWNLREIILSKLPIICLNSGYANDLGLGESPLSHTAESALQVTSNAHQITKGLPVGVESVGAAVWVDSISTLNHNVDVLATTLASHAVLVAHKTHKIVYFGWYRMSQATSGSVLFKLLDNAAAWAF